MALVAALPACAQSSYEEQRAALIQEIEDACTKFATLGPTQAELDLVRTQVATVLAERRSQPGAWAELLSTLEYRGASLNEILGEPSVLAALTVEDVRRAFAASDPGPDRRLRLIVEPQAPVVKSNK